MDAKTNGAMSAVPVPGQPITNIHGVVLNPFEGYGWMVDPQPGLTKREAFAMAAMQGLLASMEKGTWETFAAASVNAADALLAALSQEPQ